MEKRKRIYPAGTNANRVFNGILLGLALMIFLTGILSKKKVPNFQLEQLPGQTQIPLSEQFDETISETVIDLEEQNWFALQTGVFENEASAKQSALSFQKRGAAGYLWQDGRFRVMAAVYSTQEDARYVRQQLQEQHQIESYIYRISFPAMSLQLKGMRGQMEILQAAFAHVHDLVSQLQQISYEMDRQECSVEECVTKIQALQTQLDIVSLRLQQRFVSPVPETVKALLNCLNDFADFGAKLTEEESAASLGMKLKYQTFVTLWNIQEIYHTLDHT